MAFKVIEKDAETTYRVNKHGSYVPKVIDNVEEFETLGEALAEFLYRVNDDYTNTKVTLVFIPEKKK